MKCSFCENGAIYSKQNSYCEHHFTEWFESKVKDTITKHGLLEKNNKILVACSGGKDSSVALQIISRLYSNVEAIAIDEGIKGYREHTLAFLKEICAKLGVKLRVFSFESEFGFVLDSQSQRRRLCMTCGVLRRYLLNKHAKGFDKVATGHNLDDEAQSILMNLLKTNVEALVRLGPVSGVVKDSKFVPRVKPLYMCEEKEVVVYTYLKGLLDAHNECPYAGGSFRASVRDRLNEFEFRDPGSKQRFVQNFLVMLPKLKLRYAGKEKIASCRICGQASRHDVCSSCFIVRNL